MKSILPIILIVLALTGAISYTLSKSSLPKIKGDKIGIPANQIETENTPTPVEDKKVTFADLNTPLPTPTPSIILPEVGQKSTPSALVLTKPRTTTQTVCTPVYGSANTCTEHIVVDTGAENALFYNLAGVSYLAGLVSLIKAKSSKR